MTPLVPTHQLPPLDDRLVGLIRRLNPPVVLDLIRGDAGRALAWALVFEHWPELIDTDTPVDPLRRFYNHYFWLQRFAALHQRDSGPEAGLDGQVLALLEQAPADVEWDMVERIDQEARSGPWA
jgi:hypothetical protein